MIRPRGPSSLRNQLTLVLLVTFAAILGTGGTALYLIMKEQLYQQLDSTLLDKARFVMTATLQRNQGIVVYFSDYSLRSFDDTVATDFFEVYNADKIPVARSDSLGGDDLPLPGSSNEKPQYWDLDLPDGKPGRAVAIRFQPLPGDRVDQPPPAPAYVVVATQRGELIEILGVLKMTLFGTAGGILLVTLLAVWLVVRNRLSGVKRVAVMAAEIDAGTLDKRLPVSELPTELQPLVAKINDILGRLESSFERERRFSSDLAHELRTPVAELQAVAEVALTWPDNRPDDTDQTVREIAEVLEKRVNMLLALSRAEQGSLVTDRQPVSIGNLWQAALRPLQEEVRDKGLRIITEVPETDVRFPADPVLFQSLLDNLLSNAVHYTPPGSEVRLTVRRVADSPYITLSNPAPDLTPEDLDHLFDRFWRKDPARSGEGHAGLGLPLARSLAKAMGFELSAELDADKVLSLRLRRLS
jgi:two-component system sensor histidine kinase QseC